MLYRALRSVARIALRWFYRDIEVVGAERVPAAGPVLLVGNHQNALVDALVIGTALPRLVRLTLRFGDERSHWPTLVAAPRLGLVPLPGSTPIRSPADPGDGL